MFRIGMRSTVIDIMKMYKLVGHLTPLPMNISHSIQTVTRNRKLQALLCN